ncbi:MAG: phosphohistidine phosphatase SixA [Halopseudomonas sp.]
MRIWILRHGQAEGLATRDELRALTGKGREEVRLMATQLAGQPMDAILASPYLRAQQTAQVVQNQLQLRRGVTTVGWLTPDDDPRQVLDFLAERPEANVLLVSHQPLVSQLISLLVEGNLAGHYPMPTAGLASIELDLPAAGLGQLRLLTAPAQLPS